MEFVYQAVEGVAWLILYVAGMFTAITSLFFNTVVVYTVLNMGKIVAQLNVGGTNAVVLVWTFVRDLVNIFFIFGIVYIGTLLVLGFHKGAYLRTIAYILIAALLVNFSLFFTKAVIEVANLGAVQLYVSTVSLEGGASNECVESASTDSISTLWRCASVGYAGVFYEKLRLPELYRKERDETSEISKLKQQIITHLGGSVLLVMLGVLFLSAGVLLLVRFLYLLYLMVLSPFAFVAWAIPHLEHYWEDWWKKLLSQSFFAPLLFLGLWITVLFVEGITKALGDTASGTYEAAFAGDLSGYGLVLVFAVAVGMLWGSLVLARQLAESGIQNTFFQKPYEFLQKHKGRVVAGTLGFGVGGALGAALAPPLLSGAQRMARTAVGRTAGKLRDWYSAYAAKERKDMGKFEKTLHWATTRPVIHRTFLDWMDAIYKGKGEKGVAKWLAKLGTMGTGVSYADVTQEQERYLKDIINEKAKLKLSGEEKKELHEKEKEVVSTAREAADAETTLRQKTEEFEQLLDDPNADPKKKAALEAEIAKYRRELQFGELTELDHLIATREQELRALEQDRQEYERLKSLAQQGQLSPDQQQKLTEYEQRLQKFDTIKREVETLKKRRQEIAKLQDKWQKGLLTDTTEILKAASSFYGKIERAIEDAERSGVGASNPAFQKDLNKLKELKVLHGADSLEVRRFVADMADRHKGSVQQIGAVFSQATTADRNLYAKAKHAVTSALFQSARKREAIARLQAFAHALRERRGPLAPWYNNLAARFGLQLTEQALESAAKEALRKAERIAKGEMDPEEALRLWAQQMQRLVERGIAQPVVTTAEGPAGSPPSA